MPTAMIPGRNSCILSGLCSSSLARNRLDNSSRGWFFMGIFEVMNCASILTYGSAIHCFSKPFDVPFNVTRTFSVGIERAAEMLSDASSKVSELEHQSTGN